MPGFVFYRGPSKIDGAPIVAIATLESANGKTGDMVQTWILREDVSPLDAIQSGQDESICGNCQHRGAPKRKRTCYVDVGKAPQNIWLSYHRGIYPDLSNDPATVRALVAGRKSRLGSYGDPYPVPVWAWKPILTASDDHTGYSHQWKRAQAQYLRPYVMASVDSAPERDLAHSMGWRTFRVRAETEPLAKREIACPASPEGGNRKQCITCTACDGTSRGAKQASIAIIVHGKASKHFQTVTA